ncbi:MAG: hypothetical protein RLZ33_504 [Bacteroidota bacterium]|jgi:uncharacterized protein YqjF (DUF2071 family)
MTIQQVLSKTAHRPWEMPQENWKFYQEWNDAVFLHWQVDLEELKKIVPEDLEIDLFEGKPWISLVAFNMENIRPHYLPALSVVSNFPEINIRTYVKYKGKAGVHFLSIEAAKKVSSKIASILSELPYRYSPMKRTHNSFVSENTSFGDSFQAVYSVGKSLEHKDEIDLWLTERYALFQHTNENMNAFEIHHVEWPVYQIEMNELKVNYPCFIQFLSNAPDKTHYSPGVQVIAWGKKRYKRMNKEL